jgi:tungstate transport system substrate-binding protein
MRRWKLLLVGLILVLLPSSAAAETRLRLATTTSTDNSGLLNAMLPPFEKKHNLIVDVIAVGTGRALKLAENGDVDLVLVHAREAEDAFVEKGFGVNRRDVMYNDFVIVGAKDDPAGIKRSPSAAEALATIMQAGATFVSRGDDSGTHKKELSLWRAANIEPAGAWYIEAGQGMGSKPTRWPIAAHGSHLPKSLIWQSLSKATRNCSIHMESLRSILTSTLMSNTLRQCS